MCVFVYEPMFVRDDINCHFEVVSLVEREKVYSENGCLTRSRCSFRIRLFTCCKQAVTFLECSPRSRVQSDCLLSSCRAVSSVRLSNVGLHNVEHSDSFRFSRFARFVSFFVDMHSFTLIISLNEIVSF